MHNAYTSISSRKTSQSQPIFGETQIQNAAGGYVYELDAWKRFERFLILGSEGGTYYTQERPLTLANAKNVQACIEQDGPRAVDLIVGVSDSGRAPKNDPAIFSLALAAAAKDPKTRAYALACLNRVCRIPTHLFHFATYAKQFRGLGGRAIKRAFQDWYGALDVEKLAYEVVKYQSRDGWSNADILRIAHPKVKDQSPVRNNVYKWIVDGYQDIWHEGGAVPDIITAFERAKVEKDIPDLVRLHNLSREMLPTESLTKPEVWEALLEKMPLTAMIRNLGNMSKCGLLTPLSQAARTVQSKLSDRDSLRKARVHPVSILIALKTYEAGRGLKGSGTWDPVSAVVDALNDAFYAAFEYVVPTNKGLLLGIDISGSMYAQISGISNMDAAEAAAVMALAIARTEPNYEIVCFNSHVVKGLKLSKNMRLQDVRKLIPVGGSTDCASVIEWATEKDVRADAIVILTDNETWAGRIHPSQAMRNYRAKVNKNAKILNLGMTATNCTINDPNDALSLDVAGFDANVPTIVNNFIGE